MPKSLTPSELMELIYQGNRLNHRARRVTGYCWDWISRKTKSNPVPRDYDRKLDAGNFKAKWNLNEDGSLWIVKPGFFAKKPHPHRSSPLQSTAATRAISNFPFTPIREWLVSAYS